MTQKIILFIFTLFIGSISSSAQETDSLQTEPEILIVYTPEMKPKDARGTNLQLIF